MKAPELRSLEWDSAFFRVPIARADLIAAPVASVVDAALADGVTCLYVFVPGADPRGVEDTIHHGGRLVDLRVDLDLDGSVSESRGVRLAEDEDTTVLLSLARKLADESRFCADPRFDSDRVREMYEVWLRRCLDEGVVVLPDDGSGAFVGARLLDGVASIDLVYVEPAARGRRLAHSLVAGAIAETSASHARVATQAWNVAAQRLYQAIGFRTARLQAILHLWLDERI